ncbi:hypothetical protein G7Y89_g11788 [Cudoniella acicularis]|uniref:Uncharacterized protein n=1 Tax=Cudoniella acicularis TaxID=354080 RepID=A0A8H4RCH9_9HELO|nr:hypothetical protein G7Y89_g11788 [Cudoniella acicularis]
MDSKQAHQAQLLETIKKFTKATRKESEAFDSLVTLRFNILDRALDVGNKILLLTSEKEKLKADILRLSKFEPGWSHPRKTNSRNLGIENRVEPRNCVRNPVNALAVHKKSSKDIQGQILETIANIISIDEATLSNDTTNNTACVSTAFSSPPLGCLWLNFIVPNSDKGSDNDITFTPTTDEYTGEYPNKDLEAYRTYAFNELDKKHDAWKDAMFGKQLRLADRDFYIVGLHMENISWEHYQAIKNAEDAISVGHAMALLD